MKKSELLQIIREEVGKALEDTCKTTCTAKCTAYVKQELDDYNMKCRLKSQELTSSPCYVPCYNNCYTKCDNIRTKAQAKKEAEASKKKGPIASPPPKKVEPKLVAPSRWHCRKHAYCRDEFAETIKKPYCDRSALEDVKGRPGKWGRCASGKTNTVDFD